MSGMMAGGSMGPGACEVIDNVAIDGINSGCFSRENSPTCTVSFSSYQPFPSRVPSGSEFLLSHAFIFLV